MNDFEGILESCLNDLVQGASTVDECLARHPEHASQLKPLLQVAARLERSREIRPSTSFKAQARAELTRHIQTHPRARGLGLSMFQKLAVSFAVLICTFLIAGTAYAQDALPDSSFYAWKFASEHVWRAVSLDPISTDIKILNRRTHEWIAVANDSDLSNKALEHYREAEDILMSAVNEKTESRILPALDENKKLLEESGISFPKQTGSFDLESPASNESGGK